MKRWLVAVVVLGVALTLGDVVSVASPAAPGRTRSARGTSSAGTRSSHYRGQRQSRSRRTSRPVARRVGVTLPQLRSELSRLESGLGAHVQRIEKAAVRPAPRPVVVTAPAAPIPPPRLPLGPLILAAMMGAAAVGVLGFGLGRWSTRRYPVPPAASAADEPAPGEMREEEVPARRWSRLYGQLDETQQRLAAARSRLGRLERGT
jgi:hypothetical protein